MKIGGSKGPGGIDGPNKTGKKEAAEGFRVPPHGGLGTAEAADSVRQALIATRHELEGRGADLEEVTNRFVARYIDQQFGHVVDGSAKDRLTQAVRSGVSEDPRLKQGLENLLKKAIKS